MHATQPVVTDLTVRRAADGDRSAFEQLYHKNVGKILALAIRMTGSRSHGEELTQEAFVKAWNRLDRFREESSFSTWMRRLATNHIIDSLRKQTRIRKGNEAYKQHLGTTTSAAPNGSRLDLEGAIATLPDKARQVFVLHDIEGYPHDEIAQLMGTTAGTARGQLHRARRLLREALNR